jgi:hypothetical protein
MRNINKVLVALVVGGAAFGTVGAGAGASFIDSPSANDTVNTGTLLIDLSSSDGHVGSAVLGTPASITLTSIGPVGSNFTATKKITATNNGSVTGTITNVALSATGDTTPLATDLHTTVYDSAFTKQLCSGTVAHCEGANLATAVDPAGIVLNPGDSYTFIVQTYAGGVTGAPALTNVDEGKSLSETLQYTVTG